MYNFFYGEFDWNHYYFQDSAVFWSLNVTSSLVLQLPNCIFSNILKGYLLVFMFPSWTRFTKILAHSSSWRDLFVKPRSLRLLNIGGDKFISGIQHFSRNCILHWLFNLYGIETRFFANLVKTTGNEKNNCIGAFN